MEYNGDVKDDRMGVVLAAIDADASAGTLELGTGSMASVLAILTLADPAGTVSINGSGVLTFDVSGPLSTTGLAAAGAGTDAVAARIKDGAGTVIVSGLTVGTSDTNIVLDNNNIAEGQTVTITAATITHG